ncbi:MAG: phosphopantothenoylcysteine decarboxylase, partial [Syntrophothermus sp.]
QTVQHKNIRRIDVTSAGEMHDACLDNFKDSEIVVMSAAVADYRPRHTSSFKIKKSSHDLTIELEPTADILAEMGNAKREGQILAGFALETGEGIENARRKLQKKNLDLIVLNSLKDEGAGFGKETNKVTILSPDGIIHSGELKQKSQVAADIMDVICGIMKTRPETHVV